MGKRIGRWGLVNYADHPTNKGYVVFNFNSKEEADLMEQALIKKNIWFEQDEELHEDEKIYLFGVKQRDFSKAQDCNFTTSAKTRKNIIPNAFLRYGLLLFVFIIITMAIIGYIKSD